MGGVFGGGKPGVKGDTGSAGATYSFVSGESPSGSVVALNTVYTLAHTPVAGSLHCYIAGLRIAPANYALSGATVTILTALLTGALLFDYAY